MTKGSYEIDFFNKATFALLHDQKDFTTTGRDFRCTTAARQTDFGVVVITDHGGVDVAILIKLGRTKEANRNLAALKPVAEHFRHGDRVDSGFAQLAITDRQREDVRFGANRAAFINKGNVRRVGQARKVARSRRHPDTNKAHIVVFKRACSGHRHHFSRGIFNHDFSSA